MIHKEEYYWVVMKPEAETFSLGKRVIVAKLIWEDGLVEWLLPGSLALWIPDKDFMVLEKVSEYQNLVAPDCCRDAEERESLIKSTALLSVAYDALERLVNDRTLARDLNDGPEKPPNGMGVLMEKRPGVQTRDESWDALNRIIGREGVSAGFADEFDDLCESYQAFLKEGA